MPLTRAQIDAANGCLDHLDIEALRAKVRDDHAAYLRKWQGWSVSETRRLRDSDK